MVTGRRAVLITGGAGFIGSHLAEQLLAMGVKVLILDDLSSGRLDNLPKDPNLIFTRGSVLDYELVRKLVRKASLIFHLAEFIPETESYGVGHVVKFSVEDPHRVFDITCKGTLNVLEAIRRSGAPGDKKIIFASSAAVYGRSEAERLSEDQELKPISPYGAAKLSAEIFIRTYGDLYNIPFTIARIFNAYGPRQRKYVLYDLLLRLSRSTKGPLELYGTGEEIRDFIYVGDVVKALLLLAKHEKAEGQTFNVGTGIETSIRRLVELVLELTGSDRYLVFKGSSWAGDVKRLVADISRIRRLGFKPDYQLKEGLKKTINWFLGQNCKKSYIPYR